MKRVYETQDEQDSLVKKYSNQPAKDMNKRKLSSIEVLGNKIWSFLLWLETKSFALFSVVLAIVIVYYSNFFKIIFENPMTDRVFLFIAVVFYSISISIICYLSFYLPWFKNIHEDKWKEYCPNMIPMATICGLFGMLCLISAIWNIYGAYSIPLVFIIKWGVVMTAHFAPGNIIGDIIFFLIVAALFLSGYYIEHEGYLH